jgi:hypothetical protein
VIEPKYLRELAAERRAKLGDKETRLSKALDDAAGEIDRLRTEVGRLKGVVAADMLETGSCGRGAS